MLKCSQCGQYYIPGYLDCQCRIAASLPRAWRASQLPAKEKLLLSSPNTEQARVNTPVVDAKSVKNGDARPSGG